MPKGQILFKKIDQTNAEMGCRFFCFSCFRNDRFGHLTWEWEKGIRSFLHPLLFALLYKRLALLGLDTPWFMVMALKLYTMCVFIRL